MALFDLNRAQDTPVSTLKLAEIAPKNWHRYPTPISKAMTDEIYVPAYTWNGGAFGDETVAETNVLVDDQAIGDYGPRNLTEKMAWPGAPNSVVPSEDITDGQAITAIADYTASTVVNSPRGWIDPNEPYGPAPVSPTDDPTVTSLTPNTGVAGAGEPPIWVKITGTKFTPFSTVETGGVNTPYSKYVSATRIDMLQDPRSTPGTVSVKVIDHGVKSNGVNFTFT
jgi:hypothetical protein